MRNRLLLAALAATTMLSPLAGAQQDRAPEDEAGTFTFVWENDKFANTDRNYTNGVRFSWLSGTQATDGLSAWAARNLVRTTNSTVRRGGFAIGQSIFTPEDTQTAAPLPDQQPYAGWLYAEANALIEQRNVVDQIAVQIGVVGPSAGGEWAQNEFHKLIGVDSAKGWDNQLQDELGIVVNYDKKLRRVAYLGSTDFGADITPNLGLALGNVYTHARAGLTVRVGQDLGNDYGPPRVRPSLGGSGYFTPDDKASWYLFAGIEGRAVAHNIFTDGSLFNDDGVDLSKRPLVTDYQGGLVIQLWNTQLALTMVERSREYAEQTAPQRFGAFSLSQKF